MTIERPDTMAELRRVALDTMAERGVEGTTVQLVADRAGCAKSNVLYHFGSKAKLVAAALEPGLVALEELVTTLEAVAETPNGLADPAAVEAFVDVLVEHRIAAYLVLNRLGELPAGEHMDRLCASIERLQHLFAPDSDEVDSALRIAIVLGGTAFALAGPLSPPDPVGGAELRAALLRVVTSLLAPLNR